MHKGMAGAIAVKIKKTKQNKLSMNETDHHLLPL